MTMITAKVFMSGNSQAIRLPKEFRVEGDEVYIKKTKKHIVITMKEKMKNPVASHGVSSLERKFIILAGSIPSTF